MDRVDEGQPICLIGLKLHMLTRGATFNLHTRKANATVLIGTKE